MDFEPNYGSSEYSAQAEELFAQYLLSLEEGSAQEFEDFCADHEDWSDELYGLHADWDNVRGLIAQLEGKRSSTAVEPPTEVPEVETPEPPKAEEPVAEPRPSAEQRSEPVATGAPGPTPLQWKLAAAVASVAVLALGYLSYSFKATSEVLANEKSLLESEGEKTLRELETSQRNGQELAKKGETLQKELDTTLSAKSELEGVRDNLARDLESERNAKTELEETKLTLAQELETERELKLAAAREAKLLGTLVDARAMIEREAKSWPTTHALGGELTSWLSDAEDLALELEDLRTQLPDLDEPTDVDTELANSIERTQRRIDLLKSWSEVAELWEPASRSIADEEQSPLYAGLTLEPQFPLVPLWPDESTGLWTFADLQTGAVPTRDAAGEVVSDESNAAVLYLVPGIELEGATLPPIFVATAQLTELQLERALGGGAKLTPVDSLLDEKTRRELDLARLGYSPLNSPRADLARQFGLKGIEVGKQPTRRIQPLD